jgi:hypothetical protein
LSITAYGYSPSRIGCRSGRLGRGHVCGDAAAVCGVAFAGHAAGAAVAHRGGAERDAAGRRGGARRCGHLSARAVGKLGRAPAPRTDPARNQRGRDDIRPAALGKKNWPFIGRPDAGKRTAILYSIIISCLRHGHAPEAYIRDLLTRLSSMNSKADFGALTFVMEGVRADHGDGRLGYDGPAVIVVTNVVTITIPPAS